MLAPYSCIARCLTRSHIKASCLRSHIRLYHLITPGYAAKGPAAVGFTPPFLSLPRSFASSAPLATMASLESLTQSLASLSITPAASVKHAATTSPATWREALEASDAAPKSFELTKVLVYKPKTAKTATPVPLVVIAREHAEFSSGALGKKLNLKDLRLASEDLLTEFFSLDKNSRTHPHSCPCNLIHLQSSFSSRTQ